MKINIGCGFLKMKGYVNIDKEALCKPDMQFDLEGDWGLETDSVEEIVAHHTLEHLGETWTKFEKIMQEMYRVSKHGCLWRITVPHWQNDNFYHDPTHVRVITPGTMMMFDQTRNVHDWQTGGHETKLGLFTNIDIEVTKALFVPNLPWAEQNLKPEEMQYIGRNFNNACHEVQIECKVHKPQRMTKWFEEYVNNAATA